MLAESAPSEPEQWAWELKFDGYRMLARKQGEKVNLFTRNGKNWTDRMPAIAAALQTLPVQECWLDGEVVALDDNGAPDFQRLQNAFDGSAEAELVYFAFDLPFGDGEDLRDDEWSVRRARLAALMDDVHAQALRLSETFDAAPADLLASACSLGFEGIIGKRRSASYASRRSADWIKLKCQQRQEFVIGGYTDPKGSRKGIGSLLLGVHGPEGTLDYVGNVGSGFSEATLARLHALLVRQHAKGAPFHDAAGSIPYRGVHWVKPTLVAEVSFMAWTKDGHLRHPVFHGLRDDKPASEIRRELPMSAKSSSSSSSMVGQVQVSHPERVMDPESGVTKLDIVRYYATVGPLMMEHLAARPVALMRAPEGVDGERFFQKHLATLDMPGMRQLDPALDPGHAPLVEVAEPQGLVEAAQMNVVEFHTWNAKKDRIERPDRMTLDLDPGEGVAWQNVQEGALLVKTMLEELGLVPFLKTSGGKGLHVVVPIQRRHDWGAVKGFSKHIVQHLADTIPERFVAKSGPQNRKGKIFVDYLRNGRGATTVSAWSARARAGVGVSVPLAWKELDRVTSGSHWSVRNIDERLRVGNSVWDAYARSALSLSGAMKLLGYATKQE
nr:DNA ligase D [Diaphorobacter aerolatus]